MGYKNISEGICERGNIHSIFLGHVVEMVNSVINGESIQILTPVLPALVLIILNNV